MSKISDAIEYANQTTASTVPYTPDRTSTAVPQPPPVYNIKFFTIQMKLGSFLGKDIRVWMEGALVDCGILKEVGVDYFSIENGSGQQYYSMAYLISFASK